MCLLDFIRSWWKDTINLPELEAYFTELSPDHNLCFGENEDDVHVCQWHQCCERNDKEPLSWDSSLALAEKSIYTM